jgi:hypothetical protein
MPRARRLIDGAAYDADTLAVLRQVFDDVWASVAPDFGDYPEEIADARIRLATIVLALAKDHQLGPLEIARTVSRLIRNYHQSKLVARELRRCALGNAH